MSRNNKHILKTTVCLLIVAASLFCVLFGQGAHLHNFDIHIGDHFDVHAHVHAHESHDEPSQQGSDKDGHKHEVSTASDIIGTLTTPPQVKPDLKNDLIFSSDARVSSIHLEPDDTLTLFDLPPPRPVANQYHLSSFSFRGPPIA